LNRQPNRHMNAEQTINIKDTIGNPRVVFVIGMTISFLTSFRRRMRW
jgi:hypothetical protein